MSASRSERLMNLTIYLLMARRFMDKQQIRQHVTGYENLSDTAFDRGFERDKDALRAMGVPVETGSNSALFPDEVGYRIRRSDFELPPIEFTAAETTALGLATQVWDRASLAEQSAHATAKLLVAGVQTDTAPLPGFAPVIGAQEPAFDQLWQATLTRRRVRFQYSGRERTVEPWAMMYRKAFWYLVGLDLGSNDRRSFKLSRIEGEAKLVGKPGAYQIPDDVDLHQVRRSLDRSQPDATAVIALRAGRAAELRRFAAPVETQVPLPADFQAYRISYSSQWDYAGTLCRFGEDVVVLEPIELRQAVIAHLQSVSGGRP